MKYLTLLLTGIVLSATAAMGQEPAPATQPASQPAFRPATMSRIVVGTITRADGNNIVVSTFGPEGNSEEIPFTIMDQAKITVDYEPASSAADLKPGMRASVIQMPPFKDQPAKMTILAHSAGRTGMIVKIEGNSLVLNQRQENGQLAETTIPTDENTKVLLLGKRRAVGTAGTMDDLKPGMWVTVLPDTGVAKKIVPGSGMPPATRPTTMRSMRHPLKPASQPAAVTPPPNAE